MKEPIHGRTDRHDAARGGQTSVAEVGKKHGISEQTIYNWRQHFDGMKAAGVKRLKQLEQENARLNKIAAERDLELDVMREINAKKW
ncbi:transposase A [Caballeronia novacaledonica]|uniref:Transposase A n=1 Tax=Caballeronia novacaledonica TaxID=1544861 RepID=A0A2U3IFL7_9BURK|nr:transposase A [Caballeronia novacaledonica]